MLFRMGNEAEDFRDPGIEPRQRVRIGDVAQFAEAGAFADGDHAGASISLLVHGDDESPFMRRKKESAGGVAEVVLDVGDLLVQPLTCLMPKQAQVAEFAGQPSHFANLEVTGGDGMQRSDSCAGGRAPHPSAHGSGGEGNAIDTLPAGSGFRKAEFDGCGGHAAGIFLPRKLALFDDGADYAIFD
jgi:hypothetical protein